MAKRLVVVGGTGYIGTSIVRKALAQGLRVASVSRKGTPPADVASALPGTEWLQADAQDPEALAGALRGADAVISTLGVFGSYETMIRVNGSANANVAATAAAAGAGRLAYISAADFGPLEALPPLKGYFEGKRMAERAVAEHFGDKGTVLRPGMVHGSRRISESVSLPLQWVGWPMQLVFGSVPVRMLAEALPFGLGKLLTPPSSVEQVADAALVAVLGDLPPDRGGEGNGGGANILGWSEIAEVSAAVDKATPAVTLFWDGGCPLCKKEIAYYKWLDASRRRVDWVDIHANPSALKPHKVSYQEAMALIHAVDQSGQLQVGVPAFMAVWEELPYWSVLPPVLRALPGAIPLTERVYTFWAKHRLTISGKVRRLGQGSACSTDAGDSKTPACK